MKTVQIGEFVFADLGLVVSSDAEPFSRGGKNG